MEKTWNEIYIAGQQLNEFAFTNLVSLFYKFFSKKENYSLSNGTDLKILEIGCGVCNNFNLFKDLNGIQYFGFDISEAAIDIALAKFPNLKSTLQISNFNYLEKFENYFDLIIDRSAGCYNDWDGLLKLSANVYKSLNTDGLYFGLDYFSTEHPAYQKGIPVVGNSQDYNFNTRSHFDFPGFPTREQIHFVNIDEIKLLFSRFDILDIYFEKTLSYNSSNYFEIQRSFLNFVVKRSK